MNTSLLFNTIRSGQQWISSYDKNIKLDAQTRSEDQNLIDEYGNIMFEGRWNWDLTDGIIVLFYDGINLYCGDGHHRIKAAQQEHINNIYVDIRHGGKLEAQFYNCESNRYHGKRTTRKDKRNQIRVILGALATLSDKDPRKKMSDRKIATIVGVDHKTVGSVRKQLNDSNCELRRKQAEEKLKRKKFSQFKKVVQESDALQLKEYLKLLNRQDISNLSVAIDLLINDDEGIPEVA